MMQKKTIDILVAQQRLTLKTEKSPEEVQKVADLVNSKLAEVLPYGQPISHQVLLLVAMNLADELLKMQSATNELKLDVKNRSQSILSQLEREFTV